jgi:hypothetical protein
VFVISITGNKRYTKSNVPITGTHFTDMGSSCFYFPVKSVGAGESWGYCCVKIRVSIFIAMKTGWRSHNIFYVKYCTILPIHMDVMLSNPPSTVQKTFLHSLIATLSCDPWSKTREETKNVYVSVQYFSFQYVFFAFSFYLIFYFFLLLIITLRT